MATAAETLPGERIPQAAKSLPWKTIAWFGGLLILCYAPVLWRLVTEWWNNEDMGHGFFVPLVAGFIVWQRRDELAVVVPKTNYWGLAIVLFGALQFTIGTLGAERFLAQTAFIVSLAGAVLFVGGNKVFKLVAFPLFLLCFMIPIPQTIYAQITLPLQIFASAVAETVLGWVGIPVLRHGNQLELAGRTLNVVEACSGIRSLLSLSFLALIYGHLFDKKVWMKWVLLLATIPVAIAANAARVTMTGFLSESNPSLTEGVPHKLEGLVLFAVAVLLLVGIHRLVNFIYKRLQRKKEPANA
jgi:exosortase